MGRANAFVHRIPNEVLAELRCHELARAVAHVLDLPVQDGSHGLVDHSWLWTGTRTAPGNILDVYCVGRLPMVQLVHADFKPGHFRGGLVPYLYRWDTTSGSNQGFGTWRTDIDHGVVDSLVHRFKESMK